VPPDADAFSVTEAAAILGVRRSALSKMVRQQRLAPRTKGRETILPRDVVEKLAVKKSLGMSEQTANHYGVALRSFGAWLAGPGKRMAQDPFADFGIASVTQKRHARRELTIGQLRDLLEATAASKTIFRDLNGTDRHMLYLVAANTGFRVGGLAILTPACFRLDLDGPAFTLPVRADKAKRGKVQPLRPDLAEALAAWMVGKPDDQPVWPGGWAKHSAAAEMLRIDLEAAGIPYIVEGPDGPEHADFHSLRHSFLTALGRSGVDLRVQQELAGHTSSKTTERYSHVRLRDLAGAVDKLLAMFVPMIDFPDEGVAAYVPLTFAPESGRGFPIAPEFETIEGITAGSRSNPIAGKAIEWERLRLMTGEEAPPAGIEPATGGLENRCSIH
jgi:integrase/recombinase XerC